MQIALKLIIKYSEQQHILKEHLTKLFFNDKINHINHYLSTHNK